MEARDFALRVVCGETVRDKLDPPPAPVSDDQPGPPVRPVEPARPPGLEIVPVARAKVPPIEGMCDPEQRRRIVHAAANHELQAVELFAWALLAFPEAPRSFRRGLLSLLLEEQRHTELYIERLAAWGVELGDFAVSGYFWNKVDPIETPQQFVCAMSLTFENANLDHTVSYASMARQVGDRPTADLLDRIHHDEIGHVAFGWRWLERFKLAEQSMWEAYCESLTPPLSPGRARGLAFHAEPRRIAGLDEPFIAELADVAPAPRRAVHRARAVLA